jgi:RNA polymerase sigma-70 factor (ECF subfamily)
MSALAPRSASDFTAVYRRHRPFVARILYARGLRAHEADDAVQEVFLTLFRRAPEFGNELPLRAWLREVALRVSRNRLRTRRRREPEWLVSAAHSEPERVPDSALNSPERRTLVREQYLRACRLLSRLDSKHQEVVVLRYFHELSAQEIALAVGAGGATVASRLRAARSELRAKVKAHVNRP